MKKCIILFICILMIMFLSGCKHQINVDGVYVYENDGTLAYYKCKKDRCTLNLNIESIGKAQSQTYAYTIEYKGEKVYKIHLTNIENGQEGILLYNEEKSTLYDEDLKITLHKTNRTNELIKNEYFKYSIKNVEVGSIINHKVDQYNENFLKIINKNSRSSTYETRDVYEISSNKMSIVTFELSATYLKEEENNIDINNSIRIFDGDLNWYEPKEIYTTWVGYYVEPVKIEEKEKYLFEKELQNVEFKFRGFFEIPNNTEKDYFIKISNIGDEIYELKINK